MRIPFFAHFNEVKQRFLFFTLSFLLCFCISFLDPNCALFILVKPLWVQIQGPFLFTHPLEGLHASLLAQGVLGFLFCWPLFLYHFWCFLSSSLFAYEKKTLTRLLSGFSFLFVSGFFLFYILLLPLFCDFLLGYSSWFALLEPRVLDYLFFFLRIFISLIFFLLLPFILLFIIIQWGKEPIDIEGFRPWAFVLSVLLGALISPPDLTTQAFMGLLLCFWYEILVLGLWVFWINLKNENKSKT